MGWERVRGHDAVIDTFRAAFTRGRFGQAYLLLGPAGVGKRIFALELAKALLCEKSPGPLAACGACPACAQVEAGTHPDLFRVRTPKDKHELPIDEIRAFSSQMAMKPTRGSRKIGIVEDADDFNQESANAFLKTLEEPPPGSVLLLRATNIDQQLPTILSRSQVVRFSALPADDLRAILREHDIDDAAKIERLVKLAGGSAGQALALNDEEFWNLRQTLLNGITSPRPNFHSLTEAWKAYYEGAGKESRGQRLRVARPSLPCGNAATGPPARTRRGDIGPRRRRRGQVAALRRPPRPRAASRTHRQVHRSRLQNRSPRHDDPRRGIGAGAVRGPRAGRMMPLGRPASTR